MLLRAISIFVALFIGVQGVLAFEPDEVFTKVSKSVVLVAGIKSEEDMTFGSGVIIQPGEIVTNCHVIEDAVVIAVGKEPYKSLAIVRFSDSERDLCQVSVIDRTGFDTPVMELVEVTNLKVGQKVYAIGAPQGLDLTLSDGLVSAKRRTEWGTLIQTNAPISQGSSGGGLFDSAGRLIGITTFVLSEGQNLNFAIPADWIKELRWRVADRFEAERARFTERFPDFVLDWSGAEEQRRLEEERRKAEEERRRIEEARRAEQLRIEEEQRRAKREQARLEEEKRKTEAERRKREEEERRRIEEAQRRNKKQDEPRLLDEEKKELAADYEDGIRAYNGGYYLTAFSKFEKIARQGHEMAQYYLGLMFHTGRGVARNLEQAAYWYEKAASQGNILAQRALEQPGKRTSDAEQQNREPMPVNEHASITTDGEAEDDGAQRSQPRIHHEEKEQGRFEKEQRATGQIQITVLPLGNEQRYEQKISQIVSADLRLSDLFRLGAVGGRRPFPTRVGDVDYAYWHSEGAQNLVIGSVVQRPGGKVEVRFRMFDVGSEAQSLGFSFLVDTHQLRATAHKIADLIYEKLTGHVGAFSTKISYVVKRGETIELQIADADGYNPVVVHRYDEPVMSPAWSPDGTRVAYVSFETRRAIIYVLNVFDGSRKVLAAFPGTNSAPAWSPDGKRLAVTLTKDGISEIYLINADGTGLRRLTQNEAFDTHPHFSPDGRYLLFASDRENGERQIYRLAVDGIGETVRMTFEGDDNTSPRYMPDGKSFVFLHRKNGHFNIAVQDIATGQVQILASDSLDQSPTIAPNGNMIFYASEWMGRGILRAVSRNGRVTQRITAQAGDLSFPAWGPLPDNVVQKRYEVEPF